MRAFRFGTAQGIVNTNAHIHVLFACAYQTSDSKQYVLSERSQITQFQSAISQGLCIYLDLSSSNVDNLTCVHWFDQYLDRQPADHGQPHCTRHQDPNTGRMVKGHDIGIPVYAYFYKVGRELRAFWRKRRGRRSLIGPAD